MSNFFLKRIRLTYYLVFFFGFYLVITNIIPKQELARPLLTLFSINSFLYGFYISPILAAQRNRVEGLHKAVRSEANKLFAIVLMLKELPRPTHNKIQGLIKDYIYKLLKLKHITDGEKEYEALISYLVNYKGKHTDIIHDVLKEVVANQENRSTVHMLVKNKVYKSEWIVMTLLFIVTISFVLFIDTQGKLYFEMIAPMLCTGLTMLIVIVMKMNTLTHKKANAIWEPYRTLVKSNFYKVDED